MAEFLKDCEMTVVPALGDRVFYIRVTAEGGDPSALDADRRDAEVLPRRHDARVADRQRHAAAISLSVFTFSLPYLTSWVFA